MTQYPMYFNGILLMRGREFKELSVRATNGLANLYGCKPNQITVEMIHDVLSDWQRVLRGCPCIGRKTIGEMIEVASYYTPKWVTPNTLPPNLGASARRKTTLSERDVTIVKMLKEGRTLRSTGDVFGISPTRVTDIRRKAKSLGLFP